MTKREREELERLRSFAREIKALKERHDTASHDWSVPCDFIDIEIDQHDLGDDT